MDYVSLRSIKVKIEYKYNEDKILKEIYEYITSTYNQHYVGKKDVQTIDVWENMGIAEEMCMGTLMKYAMRFGKKDGKNPKDLMKLIHYAILAYNFSFMEKNKDDTSSEQNINVESIEV